MRRFITALLVLAAVLASTATPADAADYSAPYDAAEGTADFLTGTLVAGSALGMPVTGSIKVNQPVAAGLRTATAYYSVARLGSPTEALEACIGFIGTGILWCGAPPTASSGAHVQIQQFLPQGAPGVEFVLRPRAGTTSGLGSANLTRISLL